jgi:predicted metal-binding membrane protein
LAPLLLGFTLVAAGLYQFTPIKRLCLTHCRSSLAFVAQYWRDGWLGAFQMGMRHGTYCLGCCWALFAVLVVAGLMSLAWMLLLTLAVFVEKVLSQGQRISTAIGVAFVALVRSPAAPCQRRGCSPDLMPAIANVRFVPRAAI